MVECRIELDLLITVFTTHFYPAQLTVPSLARRSQALVEIILRHFRLQIAHCPIHADAGQGRADHQLLARFRLKIKAGNDGRTCPLTPGQDSRRVQAHRQRTRETGTEKYPLLPCPAVGEAIPADGDRIHLLDVRIHRSVPVQRLPQVQEHRRIPFGERIALHAATRRSCQLHLDIIVRQAHLIISCRSRLFLV